MFSLADKIPNSGRPWVAMALRSGIPAGFPEATKLARGDSCSAWQTKSQTLGARGSPWHSEGEYQRASQRQPKVGVVAWDSNDAILFLAQPEDAAPRLRTTSPQVVKYPAAKALVEHGLCMRCVPSMAAG